MITKSWPTAESNLSLYTKFPEICTLVSSALWEAAWAWDSAMALSSNEEGIMKKNRKLTLKFKLFSTNILSLDVDNRRPILEQGDQSKLHLYTSCESVCYCARDMHACYMPIFLLLFVFWAFPVENSKWGRRGDSWYGCILCFLPPNSHCKDMPPSSYSSKTMQEIATIRLQKWFLVIGVHNI